jgi:uncharacterized protein YndB with AHSA1/START domain
MEAAQKGTVIVERTFQAPMNRVWAAITDVSHMRQWYFNLKDFKAEVGFEFEFRAGKDEIKYLHRCVVTEVIEGKKITYSWHYDGYPGMSHVTWLLTNENDKTKLTLTHTGLDSFPMDMKDFAPSNFQQGWSQFADRLTAFLAKD